MTTTRHEIPVLPESGFRDALCEKAVRSLSRKIRGYTVRETKVVYEYGPDGEKRLKNETVVSKKVAPDLSAITFTLTSLDPDRWKAKSAPESLAETETPDLSQLSEEALREIAGLRSGDSA